MVARSNRAEVRNPVLALPAAKRLLALPQDQREILKQLLRELKAECKEQEARAYRQRKGPMVAYFMAVGTYAGHIANVMAKGRTA